MSRIIQEAVYITKELGNVIFIGAVAVMLHTGRTRASTDIDFVTRQNISKEELLDNDYKVDFYSDKLYTPRGIKVDMYKNRDLTGIPLDYIRNTVVTKYVNGVNIHIISLEGLIVAKYRAGRDVDVQDIRNIFTYCKDQINWKEIENITKSEAELMDLKEQVNKF